MMFMSWFNNLMDITVELNYENSPKQFQTLIARRMFPRKQGRYHTNFETDELDRTYWDIYHEKKRNSYNE